MPQGSRKLVDLLEKETTGTSWLKQLEWSQTDESSKM